MSYGVTPQLRAPLQKAAGSTPPPLVEQLILGSGTAWPHNFDTARHHGDVLDASSNRADLLHSFAAARDELKQFAPQQRA
jgi:hypothetical protein